MHMKIYVTTVSGKTARSDMGISLRMEYRFLSGGVYQNPIIVGNLFLKNVFVVLQYRPLVSLLIGLYSQLCRYSILG